MTANTTIILADEHTLIRRMLADWLATAGGFEVVASVGITDEAVEQAVALRPTLVLLDIDMPGRQAFEVAERIRQRVPETRVVLLNGFAQGRHVEQAVAIQASGYIVKTESPEAVLTALEAVATGETYFSPTVRQRIVTDAMGVRLDPDARSRINLLTTREREVLTHLARGCSKKQIAKVLGLSERTINAHCSNLMRKLSIHDRVELARFAIREGLIEP